MSGTAEFVESVPSAPVVETPVAPDASIAEHAAAFTPGADPAGPDDDDGPIDDVVDDSANQQRSRGSRAKSKQAAARINRLAGENRELRQRLDALESTKKAPERPTQVVPALPPVPNVAFAEPEPQLHDFGDKDDPYGAWQRALARWDRRKEQAEEQGHRAQQTHQQATQQTQAYYQQVESTHKQRLMAAVAANPAHLKALQSVQVQPPPLLDWSIMLDSKSDEVVLFLATHPTVLDEFVLMTEAKPVTEQTVATTRRLLRERMTAGTTGSVAPAPVISNAPRPPNPVRTGPIRTGNEPPADGSSIADHAKYYAPKPRR